ncbi:hypothetical protein AB0H63_05055 [Micromonospora echinospora]|uniref:hypothetical protein n=1 Tax=Micromonospora echinospora TaxID=1877 RepID=UPI00341073FA
MLEAIATCRQLCFEDPAQWGARLDRMILALGKPGFQVAERQQQVADLVEEVTWERIAQERVHRAANATEPKRAQLEALQGKLSAGCACPASRAGVMANRPRHVEL